MSDELFSDTFNQSRERFKEAAAKTLPSCIGFQHAFPVTSYVDHDLTIDLSLFSGGGSRLLVVQSGLHGPEGPAGSAIQQFLLKRHLERLLQGGTDVLMIHALNPYGFKYGRRSDEFNVNLNRNFSTTEEIFLSENRPYERLRPMFEPQGPVGSLLWGALVTEFKLLQTYFTKGVNKRFIAQAMNQGQYRFPEGLNYGGKGPSQQSLFLKRTLPSIFARYPGRILFLDIHTGLGEYGVLHMMNGLKPEPAFLKDVKSFFAPVPKDTVQFTDSNDPNDQNFYSVLGDVIDFVPELAPDPRKVLGLTLEFGTMGIDPLSQMRSISRVILENRAYFFGCATDSVRQEMAQDFRALFNPPDSRWRAKVIDAADIVLTRLHAGF